jgi:hypothetical protein
MLIYAHTNPPAPAVLQVVNFSDRTGRHHLLGLERFADHTGREAWDYSAWVRVYSSYLDERVGAFRWVGEGPYTAAGRRVLSACADGGGCSLRAWQSSMHTGFSACAVVAPRGACQQVSTHVRQKDC